MHRKVSQKGSFLRHILHCFKCLEKERFRDALKVADCDSRLMACLISCYFSTALCIAAFDSNANRFCKYLLAHKQKNKGQKSNFLFLHFTVCYDG